MLKEFTVGVSLLYDKAGMSKISSEISNLGSDLKKFAFAVTGAAATLFELTNISSSHSRELQNESMQLGLTTDKLQELGYAAKVTSDVGQEELSGTLQGLSKTLFDARNNSADAARTIQRLGVSFDHITSGNSTDALMDIADTFSKLPNGIYKTALANEAFGSSGAKLIPFLNQGRAGLEKLGIEAHKSGLVLSKSFIDEGAEYDRKLSKIWMVLKNITYVIGGSLIKYMGPLIDQFQRFITQNQKIISQDMGVVLRAIGEAVKISGQLLFSFLNVVKDVIPALGGMRNTLMLVGAGFALWRLSVAPIATSLAAIILAGTDLYNYFHGRSSFFGDFVKEAKSLYIFKTIGGWIKEALAFLEPFASKMNDMLHITDALKEAWQWAKDAAGFLINGPDEKKPTDAGGFLAGMGNTISSGLGSAAHYLNGMAGITPAQAGVSSPQSGRPIEMHTQVTVTVPHGTTATHAADMVSRGVEDGLSKTLRHTRNQALGGKAY